MSGFRKAVTMRRPAPGSHVEGRWVPGAMGADQTIYASVQPASGEDLERLPEGARNRAAYALFTDTELQAGSIEAKREPDRVVLFGAEYEVLHIEPWQNNVINHFKALAVRPGDDLTRATP